MKKYFIAIILIMVVVVTFYSIFHKFIRANNSTTISQNSHSGDREEQQVNTIEYGLYSLGGKYIDNGSTVYPEDDEANVNISINHNLNERREYSLIVLEDFKQVSFKLKNKKEFIKYLFTMNPNSSKDINVRIPIRPNTQELAILLIKKPSYKLKEMDLNKASVLEEVLSLRYPINHKNELDNLKEVKPDIVVKDGLNEEMFVTNDIHKLQSVMVGKEGEKLWFSTGNDTSEPLKYAIIALKNWRQTKVIDNQDVIYTTVSEEERKLFSFTLPNVKKDSNFQLIAFPYPYHVSKDNYSSQQAFGSFRTVIEPRHHTE
ncbi:hypothetical protein [Priestia megaterium]|uniref:hypothetical protein n=1 Tax=Priestia megaterium TaxID=1404 RepID=UPI002731201B|nr:hypothetical protein [Priestia megaterium]MDP1442542.1 hypothetical protein [Priestia megaterium]MDP1471621.1 hypothetical protein [Priestia megaterium]MDR0132232.1 hypothetical protein [Priestia megaterium]MDR4221775.1 hypothetical protein [Priestia megaterium]